jgi:hypothetical protein
MTSRLFAACCFLGVLVLAGGRVLAADASLCITIADPSARLGCYDAALMRPPGIAAVPAQQSATTRVVAPAVPVAQSAAATAPAKESGLSSTFGLQSKVDKGNAAKSRLEATVVEVRMRSSGQFISLDNEQVWQITEDLRDPFVKAHDAIVINPASFGSFQMTRTSGGRAVRVKRLH